jgi:hypothetical protein
MSDRVMEDNKKVKSKAVSLRHAGAKGERSI